MGGAGAASRAAYGDVAEVDASELVPGDLMLLETGSRIAADAAGTTAIAAAPVTVTSPPDEYALPLQSALVSDGFKEPLSAVTKLVMAVLFSRKLIIRLVISEPAMPASSAFRYRLFMPDVCVPTVII